MTGRRLVALFLAGVVLILAPLAEASPPDQTWIAGVWDDADYDDAVIIVTSSAAPPMLRPPTDTRPERTVVAVVPQIDDSAQAPVGLLSNHVRPPPTS